MKSVKVLLTTGILIATAIVAFALPPARQTMPALRSAAAFDDLETGDKLALVCKVCDTVTVLDGITKEEAMKFCIEGAEVTCGSCERTFKVVAHGPRSKGGRRTETRIVNDKGEECMFVTKLPD